MEAVNTSGKIEGDYTGSATMSFGKTIEDVSGSVVSTSDSLNFNLKTYNQIPVDSSDTQDLVTYMGQGQMAMVIVSTAIVPGQSGSRTTTSTRPVSFEVKGTQVEMVVTYPTGTVTFHGYIIGEGKGTHKSKVKKAPQTKPDVTKPKTGDLPELAPLPPINDETPELTPLPPINDEAPELTPLTPVTDEGIDITPLPPLKN